MIALSVSIAVLGSVVAVALVARDVAFRALSVRQAEAEAARTSVAGQRIEALEARIDKAEAGIRDLSSMAALGGRRR